MDKQSLVPNYLNSNNYKLTKAASFSELSTTKKVVIEQRQQSEEYGNLVKQYSCEQLLNLKLNSSYIEVSNGFKSVNEEHVVTWRTGSATTFLANLIWTNDMNMPLWFRGQTSSSNEYSDRKESNIHLRKRTVPPTLMLQENRLEYDQNNPRDYKQSMNGNGGKSAFEFKKPTLILKKPRALNSIDNVENSDDIVNKNNLPEIFKRNTDISTNKRQIDLSKLKKNLRSLVERKPKEVKYTNSYWLYFFIILILIFTLFVIVLFDNENCNPRFKFQNITNDLKNRVHGQDAAINDLIKYFEEKENKIAFDIIGLVGGTGVGKSYTAEIIKNNVDGIFKILDFFQPFDVKEIQAHTSLSICRCNLIKLENIKADDILDSINIINYLSKRASNYCVLVLALYNTETVDRNLKRTLDMNRSVSEISEKFKEKDLQSKILSFTAPSDDTLIKCIKDAADYSKIELTNDNIEHIKKDLLSADNGCKGTHAKVQLVGKPKNIENF